MIIETATIYFFVTLCLIMLGVIVYFLIAYMIFFVIAWGCSKVLRPILTIIGTK